MDTVSVSELKAKLSQYLAVIRRGGEVQVLDRGVPVARLVGPAQSISGTADGDAWVARMAKSGLVRAGRGDASWILDEPPLEAATAALSAALDEDREDRL